MWRTNSTRKNMGWFMNIKSYYVAMRTKLVRIASIAIAARSHPFALISLKIQLNYFAIAARPSSVPASDMHEIRNSRSVTCLPRLLVAYARSITSKYTAVRTSGSSTNWYRTTGLYPNNDVDAVDTSRRMLRPSSNRSIRCLINCAIKSVAASHWLLLWRFSDRYFSDR